MKSQSTERADSPTNKNIAPVMNQPAEGGTWLSTYACMATKMRVNKAISTGDEISIFTTIQKNSLLFFIYIVVSFRNMHNCAVRLDLKLGYACNNNCRFCVVADKRNFGNLKTAEAKKSISLAAAHGINSLVLTGGEVTIRKDLPEIITYAKKKRYGRIQVQTNGRMLSYMKLCTELLDAGANEFSPAIHGHTAALHDYLTNSAGSFKQTVQGILNLKELGLRILTNSVITKSNYTHLPEMAQLLIDLDVEQFQLAFVHPIGNAWLNFDNIVPLKSRVAPYIHKAISIAESSGSKIMIEAYPFCFMQGYEQYCSERYIPETEIREINKVTPNFNEVRKKEGKSKSVKCKKCKHYEVCEGPWKEYPERRGWDEFIPVK